MPHAQQLGPQQQEIYYAANKQDTEVRFNEAACRKLVGVHGEFLNTALEGIIKEAKKAEEKLLSPSRIPASLFADTGSASASESSSHPELLRRT